MRYNIDYHITYSDVDYCGINYRMLLLYDYYTMQSCGIGDINNIGIIPANFRSSSYVEGNWIW